MKKAQQSPSSMSYCRKVYAKQIERNESINILLKGEHGKSIMVFIPATSSLRSSKTPGHSPVTATCKYINDSPIQTPEIKSEPLVKFLMKCETPVKRSSSEEESFYELLLNKQQSSPSDGSLDDLPVLPNELHNSPISLIYNEKSSSPSKEPYKMFIISDGKNVAVDCKETKALMMMLLTELFDWDVNPDFMKFKKETSDPAFKILEQYYAEDDYENDYDEILALKMEPDDELAIAYDGAHTKRKRLYSDEYYCENINQPEIKIIKLENSPSLKRRNNSLHQKIMNKEFIFKPKKILAQKFEEEMASNDEISLLPNGTKINAEQFKTIKWNSASTATRKLLSMIFSNEILATHSLTGKPSPAFIGRERPLKVQLNPDIIEDIIATVASHTKGTPREIRAAITTKCADSAKMVRAQTQNKNLFKKKEIP